MDEESLLAGFALGAIVAATAALLGILFITRGYPMHYKMVREYCNDGAAVTYDVVGSDVGKRLMLTCEKPKVTK